MTSSQASDLKTRICNGYIWLRDNPNNKNYPEALALYESLVDEAKKLGIKERDCWPATINDAKEIFFPKQEQLLTSGS